MYIYNAELLCDSCGAALVERLRAEGVVDEGDSDGFPQSARNGGESDSPSHCSSRDECVGDAVCLIDWNDGKPFPMHGAETWTIGELLDEQLTSEGISYLREMLDEPARTPYQRALHDFWRAAFADELS